MKFKIILIAERHIELGYDLPRIPVKGEEIVFWEGGKLKRGDVYSIRWNLDDMEIWIFISDVGNINK